MSQVELFTAAQILDSGIQLPSPPALLVELDRLLAEPEVNMAKVAQTIANDPGVTAMLYKMAGSPMFGGRKAPDSVEGVASMLGLSTVTDLVRGMLLRASMADNSPFNVWFWQRSEEIADLAGRIAARHRQARIQPGQARLASLFMDCGVPILVGRHADYKNAFESPDGHGYIWPRVKEMDAVIHTDHALVGSMVAKHWKLPEFVCDAIRKHHETDLAPGQVAKLVAIMRVAAYAYQRRGRREDPSWESSGPSAMQHLELADYELEELLSDVLETA